MFTLKNILTLIGRNALIAFAVVSVTVASIVFLSNQIESVSDSVALNHRLEAELQKRAGLADILEHDVKIIGTNDVRIEEAFVSSDNILEFVSILDSLAIKNGLTQTYHFETPVESNISDLLPISTILYSNTLEANVPTFLNYLKEFERLPYFTKIEGFSISSQDPLGWLGSSSVSLRATLYTKTTH